MTENLGTPDARRREMRKAVLILALSIVVLDVLAIAGYYGLTIGLRPERTQFMYMALWTAVTFVILVPQLRKIRRVRMAGRRTR